MVVVDAVVVVGLGDEAWLQAIASMDTLVWTSIAFQEPAESGLVGKSDLCLLNVLPPGLQGDRFFLRRFVQVKCAFK